METLESKWDDVFDRLNELSNLEDGWYDGEGVTPSEDVIDKLKRFYIDIYPKDYPRPYHYPYPDGGIGIEWQFNGYNISVLIRNNLVIEDMCIFDTKSNDTVTVSISNIDDIPNILKTYLK